MSNLEKEIEKKVSKIIYDRGKSYYQKNKGTLTLLLADGNYITLENKYKELKEEIETSITIAQSNGDYVESQCSCEDYKQRKNICKHIVSLGIKSTKIKELGKFIGTDEMDMIFEGDFEEIEYEKEKIETVKTKTIKRKIDKSIKEKKSQEIVEKIKEEQKIIIENKPIEIKEKEELQLEIEFDEGSYTDYRYGYDFDKEDELYYVLRLKIGKTKKYYIKDIIKFVYAIIENEEYAITNNFYYSNDSYYFSEQNMKIVNILYKYFKKIEKKDVLIRDKKGIKIVDNFYDEIFDNVGKEEKIYIKEELVHVEKNYEPLFTKKGNKIEIRKINQLYDGSRYFSFEKSKNKMYKMKKNERKLLDEIKLDIDFWDEISESEEIKNKFEKYDINVAKYIKELGKIEIYVQQWTKNMLEIKAQILDEVIEENGQYYIYKENEELLNIFKQIFEKISLFNIDEKSYIFDYDGLSLLSEIINKTYEDKVKIKIANNIKKARNVNVSFNIKKGESNLFDFNFDIEGIEKKDFEIVIEGIKKEKKYITLTSGELIKIANDNIGELVGIVDAVSNLSMGNSKISKIKALQLSQISEGIKNDLGEINEFKKMFKKIKEKKEVEPKNVKATLFPYQKKGFNWLKKMYDLELGAILADDMGLGKTLQTITTLAEIMAENKKALAIIVVPTSLLYNWKEEIIKFSNIEYKLVEGSSKIRKEIIKNMKKGVLITTYQTLRNDIDEYKNKKFDLVILDEAQNIKTATSQIKKAVTKLNGNVNFALTGTPVENNVLELWSIFDFILPGYLDTLNKFKKAYKDLLVNASSNKTENLRKIISPFILRRTKKEVLTQLPDKLETNVVVHLSTEQKQLYMSYVKKAKKEIGKFNKNENNRIKILAILTKLRQICNSPSLFKEDYDGEIAKIEILKDILPDIIENGHRVLIFSQFVGTLKEIESELKNQKIEYFYIDGNVKSKTRMDICNKFNSGERQAVLISLKAGGTGLNLVGADVVIHYDPWWNIAVENQASDRAYRIGQQNSVQVIKLVTEGTIEEKIIKIQENKKLLSEKLIGNQSSEENIFEMNDEELMELLF